MHLIIQFFRELKKEKMRMFLTIIGISWGSANIVLMLSVGEGLHRQLIKGLHGMGRRVEVIWPGQTSKPYAGFAPGRRILLQEEDVRMIQQRVPEIDMISPEYIRWQVDFVRGNRVHSSKVSGVYPCYGEMRSLIPRQGGRFINELDEKYKRRVIFLGTEARNKLFDKDENPVGRTIMLNHVPFTVVGIMQDKVQISCYMSNDEYITFIPASTFRVMFAPERMSDLVYSPVSLDRSKDAKQGLYRAMAAKYKFDPEDKDALFTMNMIEIQKVTGMITRGLQLFLGIIGGLTLVIAGIGVANIMYVVIKERTMEIGVKMAVGARPGVILSQFVLESLITVAIGGALGMGLASGAVEIIQQIPIKHEVMDILGKPVFSALLALLCSVILGFIGFMAGVFPARRASVIDPVEALRYE